MVKRHALNVVVMDIGLPGLGGVEACRQMKRLAPNLPVLVLTSHTQRALINNIIEVGAQG
jgi:two-component system NarL family response regulator